MKYILSFLLLIISYAGLSQSKQYLYYFDKDLNSTSKQTAVFQGVGSYVNNLFELKTYNAYTKSLAMIQHFTDSSLQLSEGMFQSYYANGKMEAEGSYVKNNEDDLWQRWDSTGHVIDSTWYANGNPAVYIHRGYYKNGLPDSIIINDLKKNILTKIYYTDSGKISSEIYFTGNKGIEKRYDKGVIFKIDTVYSREEIEASFPGGADAWTRYIVSGIQRYADEIIKDNVFGSCIVKFIVNKDGKVREAEATTMQGTKLAEIALRIIRNSPKWHPASQYGRLVNAYRLQPVTITQPN